MHSVRCPYCRERLLQKAEEGVKIRTSLLIFQEGGRALVKCRKCKRDTYISAELGEDLQKAFAESPRRVVVSRGLRKGLDSTDSAK